jgi:hypothetical protein
MRLCHRLLLLSACLLMVGPAIAASPAIHFDVQHAMGANYYYLHFYVNQTLGNVFTVGPNDLVVTHLGVFDMNPQNEPYWDPANPLHAEDGFLYQHAVALFNRTDMSRIAEVIIPAGTGAPIQDEGFRYLPLSEPVTLLAGATYVLAAWWPAAGFETGGMDTYYLLGTSPGEIPSAVTFHDGVSYIDGCFNPNAGDGSTVDPPFVFNMFWGLYGAGANFLIEDAVPVQRSSWGQIKSLFH